MYATILVPVDESKLSERALAIAIPLAEQHGSKLILFHAYERVMPLTMGQGAPVRDTALDDTWRAEARAYVEKLAKRTAKLTTAPVEAVFRDGRVVPEMVAVAAEAGVGLIVMSTHGRGGFQRFWLGSVADALVRQAAVPVMLVRGARPPARRLANAPPFVRAIVPLDGSDNEERALGAVKALFGRTHARVTLVHVVHPMSAVAGVNLKRDHEAEVKQEYLEPLAQRTASATLEVRIEVKVDGNVARVLLESAEAHDADLIVIAGQGLSGLQRFLVGSVADKLIRTAPVPVLVVPTHEAGATIPG